MLELHSSQEDIGDFWTGACVAKLASRFAARLVLFNFACQFREGSPVRPFKITETDNQIRWSQMRSFWL